jgi:hypothetical protein
VDSLARHAQAAKSHGDRRFARALADRAVALGEQVLGVDHRATRNAAAVRD